MSDIRRNTQERIALNKRRKELAVCKEVPRIQLSASRNACLRDLEATRSTACPPPGAALTLWEVGLDESGNLVQELIGGA